jgi:single stranded DNA-binding protein
MKYTPRFAEAKRKFEFSISPSFYTPEICFATSSIRRLWKGSIGNVAGTLTPEGHTFFKKKLADYVHLNISVLTVKTATIPPQVQRPAARQNFQPKTGRTPVQQAPAHPAPESTETRPRSSGPVLNKVMLIGILTRDPEMKTTPKGSSLANLSLAMNRSYTTEQGERREETTFVDVEVWGRQAEIAGEYLRKGRPVYIEGRLKLDSWEDKESGQKRSKLRIVGETIQFLGSREGQGEGGNGRLVPPPQRSRETRNSFESEEEFPM